MKIGLKHISQEEFLFCSGWMGAISTHSQKALERVYNRFGNLGKFRFCDVNLDDPENVYKFLKSKKLKFKKL